MNTHEFWGSIEVRGPDDCWPWKLSTGNNGYGQPGTTAMRKIGSTAHRVAYILTNGPVSAGIKICHSCDNPKCCNPRHLWAGTNKENMQDCKAKGRVREGGRNGFSKLTDEQAKEIRNDRGTLQTDLAAKYGVSLPTISRIKRGVHYQNAD